MSSNSNGSQNNQAVLAVFALVVTVTLMLAYFQIASNTHDQSWKEFLQGIIGNIIATTLSFFAIYLFITWTQISFSDDKTSSEILNEINTVKDAVTFQNAAGEVNENLNKNWLWEAYNNRLNADVKKLDAELKKHSDILEAIRDESKMQTKSKSELK